VVNPFIAVFEVRHQAEEQGLESLAVDAAAKGVPEHRSSSIFWQSAEVFDQVLECHVY